ncbi:MAG TPA: YjbH domain-containing protein [Firmicutes bacterium]|nr:YjbH domain-containing protein [Bacillota bacterium]
MNLRIGRVFPGLRALALAGVLSLLAMGLAVPALAAPTVYGPTGLILVPTADVLPNGGLNFALHRFGGENDLTFNLSVLENLEFGVTARSWDEGHGSDALANLKFRLLNETRQGPAVAVGVTDLTDDYGRDAYVVVTKSLPEVGFRGTIGISGDGLLAGLSKELNPVSVSRSGRAGAPGTTFLLELDHNALNVGLGIGLTPQFRANVYLYDLHTPILGVSYQARF